MADIPVQFLVHTVSAETYTGTGAKGDKFATAQSVRVFAEDSRKLVLAPDGAQVMSETTLYGLLTDAQKFVEKSRVTLPHGRKSTVILVKFRDDGGLGAPQHVEVFCT